MRDMDKICGVGDLVFNQGNSRLYTILSIQNNTFNCADDVTDEVNVFDISETTFTKVIRS